MGQAQTANCIIYCTKVRLNISQTTCANEGPVGHEQVTKSTMPAFTNRTLIHIKYAAIGPYRGTSQHDVTGTCKRCGWKNTPAGGSARYSRAVFGASFNFSKLTLHVTMSTLAVVCVSKHPAVW